MKPIGPATDAHQTAERLPYGRQWITAEDIAAVNEVLGSDWLTQGPAIDRFERAIADRCGARYAVALCNGTAALHAACFAAGLRPGDEAIVPPISFVATANCVVYQGATPVFADVVDDTLTIDPAAVERAIGSRTVAVLPVDYAGHPADLDSILVLARKRGLVVIEDAAHALGATYRNRPIGGVADMTIFSFHPVKHITTGEGGIVLTNDDRLRERLVRFRSHGITRQSETFVEDDHGPWYYEMQDLGFNYRITDFQCALGLSQLARIDSFVARRREIAQAYNEAFADLPGVRVPIERPEARSAYHLYPIRMPREMRKQVFVELRDGGLGVNVHYIPIHLQPYYRKRFGTGPGLCPIAERFYEEEISLPLYPRMTDADVARVIRAVRSSVAAAAVAERS